jgi:hypothetical protein
MKIETSDRAKEFIVEHGGNVYVWSDDAGFDHTSTERPGAEIEFASTDAEGFTFHQDTTIDEPEFWKLEFHHLPRAHVTATWDGGDITAPGIYGRIL